MINWELDLIFAENSTTFCLPLNNFVCFVLKLHNFTHSTKKDDLTGNQISGYGGKTRKWRKTRSRKERKLFNKFASVPHTHSVTSLLMKQKKLTVCLTTTIFICLIFIPQPQNAMPIPETHHNHHHEHSTMSLSSAMVRQFFKYLLIVFASMRRFEKVLAVLSWFEEF